MNIVNAITPAQIDEAGTLFLAYAAELNVDLRFQDFSAELENLPGKYAPPDGALLLAVENEQSVGCVALRRLSLADAEMKRLYVRPSYRTSGVGRLLAQRAVERAGEMGYRRVLLDTLDRMHAAQALYRSLGFANIDAYCDNPIRGATYLAKDLRAS